MPVPIFRGVALVGSFRQELRECLASEKLPTNLCDDDPSWFAFIQAYAGVIDEGALVCDGTGLQDGTAEFVVTNCFQKALNQKKWHSEMCLLWTQANA